MKGREGESGREIFRMASMVSMVGAGICSYSARPSPSMAELKSGGGRGRRRSFGAQSPFSSSGGAGRRRVMVVRADTINPEIRKTEDEVFDSVLVAELAKPVTAYCSHHHPLTTATPPSWAELLLLPPVRILGTSRQPEEAVDGKDLEVRVFCFNGGTKAPGFFSVTSPTREEVRGMVVGSETL